MRAIVPEGMAQLVEVVVLSNFTRLPEHMRTVTLHQILARDKYPGATRCSSLLLPVLLHLND